MGSVIHKVTKDVDEGRILYSYKVLNNSKTLNEIYEILKKTSLITWKNFWKDKHENCYFRSTRSR